MSDLALDAATGDLALVAGAASLVSGIEATAQHWRARISLFLGEWFLDQSLGIDPEQLYVKAPRERVLRALFVRESLAVPGIASVLDLRLSLDRTTRALTVAAELLYDNGEQGSAQVAIAGGG